MFSKSIYLTTARTLYALEVDNIEIKCGNCNELIGNSKDAHEDNDIYLNKCRVCGKNYCEECCLFHTSDGFKR